MLKFNRRATENKTNWFNRIKPSRTSSHGSRSKLSGWWLKEQFLLQLGRGRTRHDVSRWKLNATAALPNTDLNRVGSLPAAPAAHRARSQCSDVVMASPTRPHVSAVALRRHVSCLLLIISHLSGFYDWLNWSWSGPPDKNRTSGVFCCLGLWDCFYHVSTSEWTGPQLQCDPFLLV